MLKRNLTNRKLTTNWTFYEKLATHRYERLFDQYMTQIFIRVVFDVLLQVQQVKLYQEELDRLQKEVGNLDEIRAALPQGCFKRNILEVP